MGCVVMDSKILDALEKKFNSKLKKLADGFKRSEMLMKNSIERSVAFEKRIEQRISLQFEIEKERISQEVEMLFMNPGFIKSIKKHTIRAVDQEVSSRVNDEHTHTLIRNLVDSKIEPQFKNIMSEMMEKLSSAMVDKFKGDLEITKQLTYSIDMEVKHCLKRMPTSANTDEIILEKITEALRKKELLQIEEVVQK